MQPTLAGFQAFLINVVGISTTILPSDSPVVAMAFAVALAIVNPALRCIPVPSTDSAGAVLNSGGWSIFALAVYNLAADNVFNYAQDLPDAPTVDGSNPPLPFFEYSRKKWNILGFVSGVIQSASDESTSETMVVQDAAKNFTLKDLGNLKTPWGRTYLGLAQSYGPTTWGIS
jgi:hypothetical protein